MVAATAAREQKLMMASSNSSNNVLMAGPTVWTGACGFGTGPIAVFNDGFNMHGQNVLQLQQNVQRQHQNVDVAGNLGIYNQNPHQQNNYFRQY